LRVEAWARRAGADRHEPGPLVEAADPAEPPEGDGDDRPFRWPQAPPAAHARPAAVRDEDRACARGEAEERPDLLAVVRSRHGIRHRLEPPGPDVDPVVKAL